MNKQEIFDKAVGGVIKQGCISINEEGLCAYRAGENKYVIGQLIPDDKYQYEMDDNENDTSISENTLVQDVLEEIYGDLDMKFLSKLQECHDECHENMITFVILTSQLAQEYNLKLNFND